MSYRPCVPPVGYLTERKLGETKSRVVPDPVRAPFMKQLYKKVACEHRSGRFLYDWIHEQGLLSRNGKCLSLSMIFMILHNPYYTGRFEYPVGGGNWYQGDYEPIVSQQLFDGREATAAWRSKK